VPTSSYFVPTRILTLVLHLAHCTLGLVEFILSTSRVSGCTPSWIGCNCPLSLPRLVSDSCSPAFRVVAPTQIVKTFSHGSYDYRHIENHTPTHYCKCTRGLSLVHHAFKYSHINFFHRRHSGRTHQSTHTAFVICAKSSSAATLQRLLLGLLAAIMITWQ
jgi:hypothetical protein